VIAVRLGVDQEDNCLIRNFLYCSEHFPRIQRAVAAIDHHYTFLGNHEAARRSRRVGSESVNTIFHFRKSWAKLLRLRRKN
jgi:hypothetical protein